MKLTITLDCGCEHTIDTDDVDCLVHGAQIGLPEPTAETINELTAKYQQWQSQRADAKHARDAIMRARTPTGVTTVVTSDPSDEYALSGTLDKWCADARARYSSETLAAFRTLVREVWDCAAQGPPSPALATIDALLRVWLEE